MKVIPLYDTSSLIQLTLKSTGGKFTYQWFEDKRFIADSDVYNTSTGEAEQLGKYQDNILKYKAHTYSSDESFHN